MTSQIIIGVPGLWKSRSDIVRAIPESSTTENEKGFLFIGAVLMELETETYYGLEIYDPDPELAHSFEIAGQGLITKTDLKRIARHTYTLYVVKDNPSLDAAKGVLRAGCALLKAGGIAVKVETAGIAFPAQTWMRTSAANELVGIYHAFVTLVSGKSHYYSCGMQNFGLPDSAILKSVDSETAANVLNRFNYYQLAENPVLKDGHTFSVDATSPRFRLTKEEYQWYDEDNILHNSFGCWVLQ